MSKLIDDGVIGWMENICKAHTDLRHSMEISQQRISDLEAENDDLKRIIASLKSELNIRSTQCKRCKTQSLDASSIQNSSLNAFEKSATSPNGPNESHHSSFGQANDEFNVAIHDMSCRSQDDEDEEEISATPVAPESAIKRERFKSSMYEHTNKSSSHISDPLVATFHAVKIKSEPISVASNQTPLRGIENDPQRFVDSNGLKSPLKFEHKANLNNLIEYPSSVDRKKEPSRKSLSLSTNKKPRLKQSMLDFSTSKSKKKKHNSIASDPDATYCDGLSSMLSRNSSNRKLLESSSTILFGLGGDKVSSIKLEPELQPRKPTKGLFDYPNHSSSSSSVFALPTQTDEIVMVEESEPMFSMPHDVKSEPESEEAPPLPRNEPLVRTDYRQTVAVRTNKEKAAQPGFDCPDCAPWFKYIGAGLTDREIQRRLDACSRHRTNAQNELPATPEGFWVPYFVDTQEEDKKETLVHYRQKN